MKKIYILLLVTVVAPLMANGAEDENKGSEVVVIGSRYDFSNGPTDIRGTILSDLGGGWYSLIRDGDGILEKININSALSIRELHGAKLSVNSDQATSPFSGDVSIGVSYWDPRWSNYGVYFQRLIESVQAQWEQNLSQGGVLTNPGSMVEVKFALNSRGEVSRLSTPILLPEHRIRRRKPVRQLFKDKSPTENGRMT